MCNLIIIIFFSGRFTGRALCENGRDAIVDAGRAKEASSRAFDSDIAVESHTQPLTEWKSYSERDRDENKENATSVSLLRARIYSLFIKNEKINCIYFHFSPRPLKTQNPLN